MNCPLYVVYAADNSKAEFSQLENSSAVLRDAQAENLAKRYLGPLGLDEFCQDARALRRPIVSLGFEICVHRRRQYVKTRAEKTHE